MDSTGYVHTNTYMYVITTDKKKGHDFEGVGRHIWEGLRKDREGGNVVIKTQYTISKINNKKR